MPVLSENAAQEIAPRNEVVCHRRSPDVPGLISRPAVCHHHPHRTLERCNKARLRMTIAQLLPARHAFDTFASPETCRLIAAVPRLRSGVDP